MRRSFPLRTVLLAGLAVLAAGGPAAAQEAPEPLPPGFVDGDPVGGEEVQDEPSAEARAQAGSGLQAAAVTQRYFGAGAYAAVRASVTATARPCAISDDGLTALVLAPVFKESSAATTPETAPSPMTLSRYDEWNGTFGTDDNRSANYGLYAFRDPYTPYGRAYWHPGIGIWQYDSAGLGAPFTAAESMDVGIMASSVAQLMSARYCSATGTDQDRRYEAWRDWGFPCTLCQGFFAEMTSTSPKFANLTLVPGIGPLGGTVKRSCTLAGVAGTIPCWYVNPSVGVIQGATAWATLDPTGGSPTVAPAPLSRPFYVLDRGTTEERHWLREDTGYGLDLSAVRTLGKNARPRSNQPGSGLGWRASSGLCDLTNGNGDCESIEPPAPPAGLLEAPLEINGTYRTAALDANGDGNGDVLWYAPGQAPDSVWLGEGEGRFGSVPVSVNLTYDDVLPGDVDGDGLDDILWYARASGRAFLWRSLGDGRFSTLGLAVPAGRRPLLLDVDADGDQEVLWYGPGAASDALWRWTGSGFGTRALSVNGTYHPFVGDFDGNGTDDVFWYAAGPASDWMWLFHLGGGWTSVARPVSASYFPLVGDFDGGGVDDVVWYAPGSPPDFTWFGGAGGAFTSRATSVNGSFYAIVADLEGDGRDDIVWYAPGRPGDYWWRWAPSRARSSVALDIPGSHSAIVGAFSTAGGDGVLWYRPGDAPDGLWYR